MAQPPVPPTKPLRGTHDLGEIVGYSYRLYLREFLVFFGLALLTVPLQLLAGVISQSSDSEGVAALVSLINLPQIFVSIIVAGSVIHATHVTTGGEHPSFTISLDAAFEMFGRLLSTTFLVVGLALASALAGPFLAIYWVFNREATVDGQRNWWLAIIPFALLFYLAIRWVFNTQAVVISGKQNWAALDDSADAVRGEWWRVFGILLVVGLIALGPTLLAQTATLLPPLLAAAIIGGVGALTLPFLLIGETLLYYDLTARNQAVTASPEPITWPEESRDDEHTS